jgi:membrane protease YdiL (CAAX protease family)
MTNRSEREQLKKELYTFLLITFAVTFMIDFIIYMISGPISAVPSKLWTVTLVVNMFVPATAAIICMIYYKSEALTKETKIIFTLFLIYAAVFVFESYVQPIAGTIMNLPIFSMIISILGIIIVILLNLKKRWRDELAPSKLSFGKNLKYYIIVPVILFLFLTTSYILNYVSGLGVPIKEFNLIMYFIYSIVTGILFLFAIWPSFFGEEYGWRVYLQDRLFTLLGGYKGVLILGIIWGLWHAPLIFFGFNYPGQPIIGIVLMVLLTIVLGIIFSYAVLKTGSVWIAVILHLIVDTVEVPATTFIASSTNPILSFGVGIFGVAIIAIFALILLRSKVWKLDKNLQLENI